MRKYLTIKFILLSLMLSLNLYAINVAYISGASEPWNKTSYKTSMNDVFGEGNWTDYRMSEGTLPFEGGYNFIYIEGSDQTAAELQAYLDTNRNLIETYVSNGGTLFLDSAENDLPSNDLFVGFGDVHIITNHSSSVVAVDSNNPIWNGPFTPVATTNTGSSFGHSDVRTTDNNITTIITGSPGDPTEGKVVFGTFNYGDGFVMIGGMTAVEFHAPYENEENKNLLRNILSYVGVTIVNELAGNSAPTSADKNITMDEDTTKTFILNDFNFTDIDAGDTLDSIYITALPTAGALTLSDTNVTLNQKITEGNITNGNLKFIPVANEFGNPYTTFEFKVNDGEANSTSAYTLTINVTDVAEPNPPAPTPTPTPEPEPEEGDPTQILISPASEVSTEIELDEVESNDEFIVLTYTNKNDGSKSTLNVPQLEGKTINIVHSSGAIELTTDDRIASYNNNGTTEHSIKVGDNNATVAVSYLSGSFVQFTPDGGVQTSVHLNNDNNQTQSNILIVATPKGYSQNSITRDTNVTTRADSMIPGTQTVIQEDGDVVVDTPQVLSSLGNNITTTTTLDANGKVVITALKVRPDGTEENVVLGTFEEGSEAKIQNLDGAVVVEIVTELGTEKFTLRSGRK